MSHKETILYSLKMIDNLVRKLMDRHITADKQGLTIIKHIAQIKLPEFSIKGRDVIAAGIKDNRKIGEVLDELEQIWIDSDFNLSHEELLQRLPELILQKSA